MVALGQIGGDDPVAHAPSLGGGEIERADCPALLSRNERVGRINRKETAGRTLVVDAHVSIGIVALCFGGAVKSASRSIEPWQVDGEWGRLHNSHVGNVVVVGILDDKLDALRPEGAPQTARG